jgi:prepilin-type N-terminal cleavage/methylation domain-containing protein
MLNYRKSFTLVEMLVALAVSSIIIIASYASYDLVATQYRKNLDVADMHTSGRAIMRIIERDIRMAGFEYRDKDAKVTYGAITLPPDEQSKLPVPSAPLDIDDSDNKCCDKVRVIYDYFDEESKKAERIRIRYWTEHHKSNKGSRYRLFKQKDILGQNKKILAKPKLGTKDVMADYIEDLQFENIKTSGYTYIGSTGLGVDVFDPSIGKKVDHIDINGLKGRVGGLAFDPKGFLFAGSSYGGGIYKINISTRVQTKINTSIDKVTALAYNNNTQKLYVGIGRGNIYIINPNSGKIEDEIKTPIRTSGAASVSGATSLAFNKNGLLYIGHSSHYNYVIVDPITKQAVGDVQNYSLPQAAESLAGDAKGYMYAGGGRSKVLTPFSGKYVVTDRNIKSSLMSNGVFNRDRIEAAAIGSISTGQESLVSINLTLRTKNQYGKDKQFKKKDYHAGNYKLDKTDKYKRDTFSSTVLVRNLAL